MNPRQNQTHRTRIDWVEALGGREYPLGLTRLQWVIRTEVVLVLKATRNKQASARILGISRQTLDRYLHLFQVTLAEWD